MAATKRPRGRRIPESTGIDPRPLRTAAYAPPLAPDADPGEVVHQLQEMGLLIRMRRVARMERTGMTPERIAVELAKGSDEWSLELVLALMGLGDAGTPEQKETLRQKYLHVSEETYQAETIDPEAELAELQTLSLRIMKNFLEVGVHSKCPECGCTPKESFEGALKALKMNGIGAAENVTVRKIVMDPETIALMREFLKWKEPPSRLHEMIEAELVQPAS